MEITAALDPQFPISRGSGGQLGRLFGQGRQLVDNDLGLRVPQSLLNGSRIEGAELGDSSSHIGKMPRPGLRVRHPRDFVGHGGPTRRRAADRSLAPLAPATKILIGDS